jgi:hypothetical protein
MAHKKAGGSSRNGRDSAGQRLGLKIFGGEQVIAGNIANAEPNGIPAATSALAGTIRCSRLPTARLSSGPKPRVAYSCRYFR